MEDPPRKLPPRVLQMCLHASAHARMHTHARASTGQGKKPLCVCILEKESRTLMRISQKDACFKARNLNVRVVTDVLHINRGVVSTCGQGGWMTSPAQGLGFRHCGGLLLPVEGPAGPPAPPLYLHLPVSYLVFGPNHLDLASYFFRDVLHNTLQIPKQHNHSRICSCEVRQMFAESSLTFNSVFSRVRSPALIVHSFRMLQFVARCIDYFHHETAADQQL
jgi:hypothetical protein